MLPGDAVVVGMAFRYRGDACFRPAAPDPAEDARIRGRDPYVFEAATLTLGAGERVVGATWKSEFEYVKQITFTTSRGRVHAFGAACPRAPAFVDAASEGGAALVGFRGLREVYVRCEDISRTGRGDAAAATWIFRGDESRRRRGRDVETSRPAQVRVARSLGAVRSVGRRRSQRLLRRRPVYADRTLLLQRAVRRRIGPRIGRGDAAAGRDADPPGRRRGRDAGPPSG